MKNVLIAAFMALCLALPAVAQPLVDYAPTKPVGREQVSSALPYVSVRFDDGRDVLPQIREFLRRQIPVTLSINAARIGNAERLTWAEIRGLMREARSYGTTLHIAQHTNTAMSQLYEASSATAPLRGYPAATDTNKITYAELLAEFDPTVIIRNTGYRPRVIAVPGNPGVHNWKRRHERLWASVADSMGLWWSQTNVRSEEYNGHFVYWPGNSALDGDVVRATDAQRPFHGHAKPGWAKGRHYIPSETIDLGNQVVERYQYQPVATYAEPTVGQVTAGIGAGSYGELFQTGILPPTHTESWTLALKGADAAAASINDETWARYYTVALAASAGFSIALHDDQDDVASSITGIDDDEIDSAASSEHIAWTLARLQALGLIKCVGAEEYSRWVMGEFVPGTQLNWPENSIVIPQYAIGDTLGWTSEYPWPAGWGVNLTTNTGQVSETIISEFTTVQTGNLAKYDRSSYPSPYYSIGDSLTGIFGRRGAIALADVESSSESNSFELVWPGLEPGRYTISLPVLPALDITPQMFDLHQRAVLARRSGVGNSSGFEISHGDTLISYQWNDTAVGFDDEGTANAYNGLWIEWEHNMDFPTGFELMAYDRDATSGESDSAFYIGDTEKADKSRWWLGRANWAFGFLLFQGSSVNANNNYFGPWRLIYEGK